MSLSSEIASLFISENQSSKYITHNQAILLLAVMDGGVISRAITAPPTSPVNGDAYIIPAAATGAWTGRANQFALYYDGWRYVNPIVGPLVYVTAESLYVNFNGTAWVVIGVGSFDPAGSAAAALASANAYTDIAAASTLVSAQAYADGLVVGLWNDRGVYDASGGTFPASGGSGTAGAIRKGDIWTITVAGVLGGVAVSVGDVIRALVNTPGQTAGNWAAQEGNLGYAPVAGPSSSVSGRVAVFDDTSGKLIADGGVLISSLALDADVVKLTGDQTVAGIKNFSDPLGIGVAPSGDAALVVKGKTGTSGVLALIKSSSSSAYVRPSYSANSTLNAFGSDCNGAVSHTSSSTGGLGFYGFTSSDTGIPLAFIGYGNSAPSVGVVQFVGRKHNGSNNFTSLAATEPVADFINNSTVLARILGSGAMLVGTTTYDGTSMLQVNGDIAAALVKAGFQMRTLTGDPTFGALYPPSVTPSASNYALISNSGATAVNGGVTHLYAGGLARVSARADRVDLGAPVVLWQRTLATLPAAAANAGRYIDVTDSTPPGLARSNGANWIGVFTNAPVV